MIGVAFTSESIVVRRAKKGDQDAFEQLVTRYEKKVYSLAYHYAGNEQDAMDISQEAFLRVYRFLPQFNEDSQFSTWLYRVTSNVCKDYLRKRNTRAAFSLSGEQDGEEYLMEAPDLRYNPEDLLEQKEMRRQIREGLEQLNPDHREILVMRDVMGLTYGEIASSLELEEGTVKSRIARAREKLRQKLMEKGNFFAPQQSNKQKGGAKK